MANAKTKLTVLPRTMTNLTLRLLVFHLFFATAILPGYLAIRFGLPEMLWLYVPILSIWGTVYLSELEKPGGEETPQ